MTDEKDIERTSHLLARARVKRTTIISQIRAIHAMALRVQSEPDLASEFALNAADLDALWFQFRTDDDSVLDLLAASDKLADYSPDLIAEVRQLINSAKNIAQRLIPKGADAVDLSYLRDGILSVQKPREDPVKSLSRLPDIPLPTFDGDYRSWPNFRDRFSALVDTRSNLSNIDKMYYLIGCLKGAAADAVRGIPVSADNYELVMNTLSNKFNRPRLVATSLVDKLLQSSAMTQESLNDLNTFVGTFSESISLLDALKIPDTGSFILFSIAFRRLPVSTRKLFEANSTVDYPSIGQLLDFLRSRVAILEVVGESHKGSTNNAPSKSAGGDIYASIMDGRKFSVDKALPTAFSSIFGWILIGPVSEREAHPYQSMPVAMTVSIEGLMERFWQVEEPEAAPATFTDEGRCEKLFCEQSIRLPCGRFSVPLPFRAPSSADTFAGSRELAVRRFDALERKLATSPQLKSLYVQFMSEYISLGHMSVATSPGRYFIPHHAVYRPAIDENKIRVVFDASAQSSRGPSLNNCLFTGPKLQQDIVDILTRFRVPKYVFTTDICKMYRQILILPEYRQFQHILWRPSPHDELVEYELNTVTYGVNCAPYLALRVLQTIASDDCDNFEFVRNALTRQTYVDDICDGADTMPSVLKLQSDLISVIHKAGLELKKVGVKYVMRFRSGASRRSRVCAYAVRIGRRLRY
ncbi:hypothetical protein QTP88_019431 [Uroleucon formosanum]